jgi:GntR family transcriptional regulator / MocR family aminotransferase
MVSFRPLIPLQRHSNTPLYLQLASCLIAAIQSGNLKPGTRLPSIRTLADDLQLHRKTVVAGYEELILQGWLESVPRKGIFVARKLPEVKPKVLSASEKEKALHSDAGFGWYDEVVPIPVSNMQHWKLAFNDGFPDVRLAPVDLLAREFRSLSRNALSRKYLMYADAGGSARLRQAVMTHLAETRMLVHNPDRILITRGSQMSLYLVGRLLLKPGDGVVVGEPNYFAANQTFQQMGGVLHPIPVDDEGVDTQAIEAICRRHPIKLVYVVPHHHHPTTVTLPAYRRMRLLELARAYGFAILEDDYDFDYHFTGNPILPLAHADTHNQVIYIGSVCKTVAPSLRIGFMFGPADFIASAIRLRRMMERQGDSLLEEALATLYENGDMTRHLKKTARIYHQRRDVLCDLLRSQLGDALSFRVPDGGMAVWTVFSNDLFLPKVAAVALEKGLVMNDGTFHNTGGKHLNATRLGFASLNESEMEKAVGILSDVVRKMR